MMDVFSFLLGFITFFTWLGILSFGSNNVINVIFGALIGLSCGKLIGYAINEKQRK